MRALVLTSSFPCKSNPMSGRFVGDLLAGLASYGWEFDVVTPQSRCGAFSDSQSIRVHPANFIHPGTNGAIAHGPGLPEVLSQSPRNWSALPSMCASLCSTSSRILKTELFDVLWSHWLFPSGIIGDWLSKRSGVPHLVTAHGTDVHVLERIRGNFLSRGIARDWWSNTRLSTPAKFTSDRVSRCLDNRVVETIPLPAGQPPWNECDFVKGQILFLGRFEPIKGPDILLHAFERVRHRVQGELVFAGSGSMVESLRWHARAARLPVRFTGVLGEEEKRREIGKSRFVVLPSRTGSGQRQEGFPHVAMEALALGVPVIVPSRGAVGELIKETGAGFVYDVSGDEEEQVRGLASILEEVQPGCPVWQRAQSRARRLGRQFHPEHTLPLWDELLRSLSGDSI